MSSHSSWMRGPALLHQPRFQHCSWTPSILRPLPPPICQRLHHVLLHVACTAIVHNMMAFTAGAAPGADVQGAALLAAACILPCTVNFHMMPFQPILTQP